jgi:hypothetical protein
MQSLQINGAQCKIVTLEKVIGVEAIGNDLLCRQR